MSRARHETSDLTVPEREAIAKSGLNPALSRNREAPEGDEPGRLPLDMKKLSREG